MKEGRKQAKEGGKEEERRGGRWEGGRNAGG